MSALSLGPRSVAAPVALACLAGCSLVAGLNDYEIGSDTTSTHSSTTTQSSTTSTTHSATGGSGGSCTTVMNVPITEATDISTVQLNAHGNDPTVAVSKVAAVGEVHTLLRAPSLLANVVGAVAGAELCLFHASPVGGVGNAAVSIYPMTQDWSEALADWGTRDGANAWLGGPGGSHGSQALDTIAIDGTAVANTERCWDILPYVQVLDASNDLGLLLAVEGIALTAVFHSDDSPLVDRRPVVRLTRCD